MRRQRKAKIVATLGPASSTREQIAALFKAGADVFRLNFSHGTHEDHQTRYDMIRAIEEENGRPIGILMDLQGPKLRVGTFAGGSVELKTGGTFRLDLDGAPGDAKRAQLPHPEIFAAVQAGTNLLLDDGKLRLRVKSCGKDFAESRRRGRRQAQRPQGRQRAGRRAAAVAADRQGPRGPALRPRSRRRLGRAVVRAAPGGRRRGCAS